MLLRGTRRVQILPLLCAVCHLTLSFPVQTPPAHEEVRPLQVSIPHSGPLLTPLGSSISIPCFVSLSSSSSPVVPRIKWTVVSGGVETQILVARDQRVKLNDAYQDRASLFNYTYSPDDASLWLGDLRHSDSGYYRCEVQQGLEDASDIIQVKVKGVVFHYRDTLGRYAFSFQQAQKACGAIGAQIATPDQLLAAYYDGYEQCDAGWLADQSVSYPIQVPREGCYGDMDGQPGVRNYGTMDPKDLYDVYCYIEKIDGEVFHDFIPQQLSFDEARSYCEAAEAELATTAQLYFAWSEGLDRCSPGWLADGSVRYPIVTPRERCGGLQAGVKTLYRFSNQTGFPEPFRLYDVYCFKEKRKTSSDSPVNSVFTEAEDAEQNVIFFMEKDQEIQLNQQTEQVEREVQSVLESLPVLSSPFTVETLAETHPTVTPDFAESSPSTSALDLIQLINETSETSLDSEHPTEVMNTTISETEPYNSTQSTSFSLGVYNQTDSQSNLSFTFLQSEIEKTTYKPHTENQTGPGVHFQETTYLPGTHRGLQNTSLSFERLHTNYSNTERNYTQEESFWEAAATVDSSLQVKLEEAAVVDPEHMSLSTQAPQETHSTDVTQMTESAIGTLTSLWDMDGSGDVSQEKDVKVEVTTSHSATGGFTTHPFASASRRPTKQTIPQDVTFSPESHYVDTASSEIFFTSPHLWESSVSRQEGSTSLETGDMEAEEIQTQTTQSLKWVVSKVSSTTTETPEGLNTSQSPSEFATTQNQTSGYILYFDSSSSAEDVSGYEPRTDNSSFQENNKFVLAPEEQTTASPTYEEEANVSIFMEDVKVASTSVPDEAKVITTIFLKEEETNGTLTTDTETKVASTMTPGEGTKAVPTFVLEESAKVTQTFVLEEGAKAMPTKVVPTLEGAPSFTDLEDDVSVVPTHVPEEGAKVAPTHVFDKTAKIVPTLEEDTKAPSFFDLKDEVSVAPISEEKVSVVPTHVLEEEAKVVPTLVFEKTTKVAPTIKEEAKVLSSLVEEEASAPTIKDVKFAPTPFLKKYTEVVPTVVPEEVKVAPTIVLKEIAKVDPTLEEAKVLSSLNEEEGSVAPVIKDVKVAPTLVFKEDTEVVPNVVFEDIKIAPTFVFKETAKVDPTLDSQKEEIPSTHDLEEEASATPTMEEEVKLVPTFVLKEYTEVVPTVVLEEAKIAPTFVFKETAKIDPTLDSQKAEIPSTCDHEEEASAAPTMEEEVKVVPTFVLKEYTEVVPTVVLEEAKIAPTIVFKETAKVDPTLDSQKAEIPSSRDLEEEASAAPTMEEEVKVVPTFVLKEFTEVVPTVVLEEAKVAPTIVLEETAKVDPTLDLQEAKRPSTYDLEEEASTAPTMEEEVKIVPTFVLKEDTEVVPTIVLEETAKVDPTIDSQEDKLPSTHDLEEEASAAPTMEEEVKVFSTFVIEEVKVAPTHSLEENEYVHVATNRVTDKEAKVTPTFVTENIKVAPISDLEEETKVVPNYADFTISPLSSQTSKWTLLTTPTEPQGSLVDVGFHQRPSAKEVSDLLTVHLSTKPTAAAAKTVSSTITTTTHQSRHIWSPTTTRPKSIHETIQLQKVTHVIPPVDHGLVELELGLTKPPTLLILPNERAAVGGAGKYSDVCLDDPCLNGGTCTEQDGQIRCLCLPTYGGVFCQTDLERCDPGWDKFHGFCYRHFSQRQSWEVAEQHCRMQGAHLVSIMSPEEQDYINSNYKEYQWTGLNDKTIEDDFRWSDGNPLLYENWYRGQPDSYFLSGEDCVVMVWHDSGRWSDVPCNYHLAYTCKKGTSSCGPPPKLPNASIFGKPRHRYETGAVVRYRCTKGFQQRLNPLIKCLSGGQWQRPQIRCTPEAGGIMQHPDELSLIDSNFAAAENELEATKETPQYWDIKF